MATFYIEAIENTNIALVMVGSPTIGTVKYGVNDSTCPNTYTVTTASTPISLTAGQKCYWTITSTSTDFSTSKYLKFTSTAKINVGGALSDLIGGTTMLPRNYCFTGLFRDCTKLIDASNLVIVSDFNSKNYCYFYMFRGCTSLTTAPELPATTLTTNCYNAMFYNCTSLTTAPALPVTTLANSCYYNMFYGCKSLTTAPALPATTLTSNCYNAMFRGCTSLTTAPALPATALGDYCYSYMFYGCTSLTTAPALPATTLTSNCYNYMFSGCSNIKLSETQTAPYSIPYRIPSEGTGTEGTSSLSNMFNNTGGVFAGTPTINTTYYLAPYATFYIEAVEDTDIKLSKFGTSTVGDAYYGVENHNVPNAYTYGNTIHLTAGQKCYWFITSTSEDFGVSNYLNFTSTAKINVGGNMSDLIGGESKIPRGYCFRNLFNKCTNLVSASNLVLVNDFNSKQYCYEYMFYGCTSLTAAPELPATTLTAYCYNTMFYGCTSLTTAPTLPATTLEPYCYQSMFYNCTSLTTAPALPATTLEYSCYRNMFQGCTSLTTTPELPATTLAHYCYHSMFKGCTNIKLSETQTTLYSIPYRIPSEGVGTEGTSSLTDMFASTGGAFTGTPTINTIYYLLDPYATFYIEAVEDTDIILSKVGNPTVGKAYYGVNDQSVPNAYNYGDTIHLTAGQKCYWFITSTTTAFSSSNYLNFTSTKKINVGGNMSDLIGEDTKIPRNYCFTGLFRNCGKLVSASNLIVVDDFNSKQYCYYSMFYGCTSLTAAPELPATTLAKSCYLGMFSGCTSLTTAPELPATTLADNCYSNMFFNCTSLTTAPTLPATTLANSCYYAMFQGCTSLTTAPELPATTLAYVCYNGMFYGCSNIKLSETQTAPYSIPYRIPSEGTGTVGASSLDNMFVNTGGTFKGTPTINTTYYLAPYATFYIEAVEDTDITLSKVGTPTVGDAYYGVENHNVPNAYTYGDTIHLTAGQKCYWFVTSTSVDFDSSNYLKFTSTAKINVGGNMSDLIGGNTKIPRGYCFNGLFMNCTKLVSASNLIVVDDFNLKTCCYYNMFYGCTSLITAPELPATTLTSFCYQNMFYGCTSLATTPTLPATTIARYCYSAMFQNCTSLTTPPALPATTLTDNCYERMFYNCSKIKLSETQVAPYSIPYRIPSEGTGTEGADSLAGMFNYTGGTFKRTPTINTTYYLVPYATFYIEAVEDTNITLSKVGTPTVGDACYGVNNHVVSNVYNYGDTIHLTAGQKCYWFVTSTSDDFSTYNYLKFTSTAKINVGGNLSDLIGGESKIPRDYCFNGLFYYCTNLVNASNLVLVNDFNSKGSCYLNMFQGCTSLTTAPTLPATTLTTQCYNSMFYGCTSLTTPPALPATTLADYCYLSMFNGCTSLTTPPHLPATTLASGCYWLMFSGCTSLVIAPELPATTLAGSCYQNMFIRCTSLTTAPTLPATTLAPYCYSEMFRDCTSLTTPPALPATTLAGNCYSEMFRDCTSLTTPPALPATTLKNYCYKSMFQGCTNIKLSETQTAPYSIPYRIPSEGTGTEGTGSLDDMFTDTGGTFKGTPTISKIYYLAPPSSPIYITYKGQELANFESGSKTLKCGGKYMEGDVIIAREIGTNNVVVLYNSGTILTFQNGTKTLKCAGKGMATDLVVQTS